MGLGLSLCLSQVTAIRQELRLDADDSNLRATDLPKSARVLSSAQAERLCEGIRELVRERWHDRALLDYVLGLLVPPSRKPMRRYYEEGGPSLRDLSPREDIRKLDAAVADALRGLRLAFDEVERQVGAPALESWHLTCGVAGLDPTWFAQAGGAMLAPIPAAAPHPLEGETASLDARSQRAIGDYFNAG
jgi:hypothetical protein